jgi:glycosyltransferase involved in cell wall biosynthesis
MDLAVLVSSYQRSWHLARVLASIEHQRDVAGRFEVVVTDDGSTDDTQEVVERFARRASFPVRMTTHNHDGFQLARCRNEGVMASRADYLLFLDGDCLIPPDHLWHHLQCRRQGIVQAGYCCLLDRAASQRLTLAQIERGEFCQAASSEQLRKLARMHRKARWYCWLRHPSKPKLFGGNVGIHRSDYLRVNGYDENFQGWGCEDDDLRLRLRSAGVRIHSILDRTWTYHLWHPPGASTPDRWRDGSNVRYLRRQHRPVFCQNGLCQSESSICGRRVRV